MEMPQSSNSENGYSAALGTVFLRQFTSSFDFNKREFSLAPSITSVEGTSIKKTHNSADGNGFSIWEIFGIAAAGFFLILIIIAIIVYCISREKQSE